MMNLLRRLNARYQRSWMGQRNAVTNGRLLAITVAVGALIVVVPYWNHVSSQAERARDCEARAIAGKEIKATAMAGVVHAEQTAELMDSITVILESGAPGSPLVVQIRREVDRYAAGVVQFRDVAEQYTPVTLAECGVDR